MRRIIHNTTAIAACLSLLAPHLAMAQDVAPDEVAQEQQPTSEGSPTDVMSAEDASCVAGAEPPCPVAEDAGVDAGVPAESEAVEEAVEAQPQPAADEAADAASEPAGDPVAEETAVEPEAAEPETAPETAIDAPDAAEVAPSETDPLADALAEQEQQEQDTAPAETVEAEPAAPELASPPVVTEDAPASEAPATAETDAGALARALAEQEESQQDETQQAGETAPDADAPVADAPAPDAPDADAPVPDAESPTDTATTTPDAVEPQADPQTDPQAAEADIVPEQGLPETEAAREAAEVSDAPTAAALDDQATSDGRVTEEEVTEESRRSSSEDFATSLRDALSAATGQEQAAAPEADEGSDRNDLGRALLLGLGGIAVGAMLTNNRQVALSAPDRVVVTRPDGSQQIIKDEVALLRQPGSTVATENFDDGSSRTIVTRADGSRVVTIRDADLRVLRRTLVSADGTTTRLIDDSMAAEPVDIGSLPPPARPSQPATGQMNEEELRAALQREANIGRGFTLAQVRNIPEVRALVAPVNIDAITFDTGSAAINPDQARQLSTLGNVIRDMVAANPQEILLIEGHTDTVGAEATNLALSDRRAESVALALSEYFDVPPENMVVQGYGEQFLKLRQEGDVRENRRASVRRITDLLRTAAD